MGMSFSKLIRKETLKVLDEWLKEREGAIVSLKAEIRKISEDLKKLKDDLSEIQQATIKVPVEEHIFHSQHFQTALEQVTSMAMQILAVPRQALRATLPSLKGTVTPEKPFEIIIDERTLILLAGLKTTYKGEEPSLYLMQIGDRLTKPFPVDKETKQVIFLQYYLIKPMYMFRLRQTEGSGTLNFSLIGATITTWSGL
jgi:hypothetical protein